MDTYTVGLDIGGTFTDAAAIPSSGGQLFTAKTPTTPDNLRVGLAQAVEALARAAGLSTHDFMGRVTRVAHATTQTSNVMFTWSGAPVSLITTRGFRDELLIMRARGRVAGLSVTERRHLQRTNKPPQIVPAERIHEIRERIDHTGTVVLPLHRADVEELVRRLVDDGIRAFAVCLLWSPRNPSHELMVEEVIREVEPSAHVSLSHAVAPVLGEYERAATAAVNAYVAPIVEEYFASLEKDLRGSGMGRPLMVIQADGGSTVATEVIPVRTIESGPAAGMVAVKQLSDALAEPNVIATDVGGTTFKVGLLQDRVWSMARETVINQYTLALPMIDLVSIGAGGGSIAWVDEGRLRVGPESAAADPGPACYGLGGVRPTVTDADVALGFIGTDRLLGGRIRLDPGLAAAALREHVADPMFDGDVTAAASAVRQIIDSQMTGLVRKTTLERGFDPRAFVLMAYGGAGPVHAADYASGLGIRRVVIPGAATVYSALGGALSDIRFSVEQPVHESLSGSGRLRASLAEMEEEARKTIARLDMASSIEIEYWADVRYEKQLHSIRIALEPSHLEAADIEGLFVAKYSSLYGHGALLPGVSVVVLRIGVDGIGLVERPALPTGGVPNNARPATHRDVYWPSTGAWQKTTVWDGTTVGDGSEIRGPSLVEYPGTTAAIPDGAIGTVDGYRNLIIDLGASE